MFIHTYRVYYKDLPSRQEFLDMTGVLQGAYLRFLNVMTRGNPQMMSVALDLEIGKVYELIEKYELGPEGDVLTSDESYRFYEAAQRIEDEVLEKQQVKIDIVVSVRAIVSKALIGLIKGEKDAFTNAQKAVILERINLLDEQLGNHETDDAARALLNEEIYRTKEEIKGETILNLMSNHEIRMRLYEIIERYCPDYEFETEECEVFEMSNCKTIEDVIGKPAEKMTKADVDRVVSGCPIVPIRVWEKVRDNDEYLRCLKTFFPHVSNIKMADVFFNKTVSNSTLGDKFKKIGVPSPKNMQKKNNPYLLENQAFDKWMVGEKKKEEPKKEPKEETKEELACPDKEIVHTGPGPMRASKTKAPEYRMSVEFTGKNVAQLYALFAELYEHFDGDPRARISMNPLVSNTASN